MKKWKATVWLTILLVITAALTFLSFARFPVGTKDFNGFLGAIQTDYDISGGTAYTLTLADDNETDVDNIDDVIGTIKYRLNALGYQTYSVKAIKNVDAAVKDYDIRIETRGRVNEYGVIDKTTLNQDISVVAAYGELTFKGGTSQNPTEQILTGGKAVADAYYAGTYASGSSVSYNVNIVFTDYGYKELMSLLEANSTYYVQIEIGDTVLLQGTSALSASYIQNKSLVITTGSESSARQAALQIKSGGLAYKYDVSDGVDVSSPFGYKVALKCVLAVAALLIAICALMFVMDKAGGISSLLSVLLSLNVYLFLLIAIPGIKISLGGVMGFALSFLLTVGGLYSASARIKEEFANGKTVKSSVKSGFRRIIKPVTGTCGISAAFALILFAFASGAVRNFAVVFAIGCFVSAAATLLFNRAFTSLILVHVDDKEKFLGLKRNEDAAKYTAEVE